MPMRLSMPMRLIVSTVAFAMMSLPATAGDPTKQPNYDDGVTNIRKLKKDANLTGDGARLGMIEQGVPISASVTKKVLAPHLAMLDRVLVTEELILKPLANSDKYFIFSRRHAHAVGGIMIADDSDKNGKNNAIGIAHKATLRAESAFLHPDHATRPSDRPIKVFQEAAGRLLATDSPSVLNLSWGYGINQLPKANPEGLRVAADWVASSKGLLVVVAAGHKSKAASGYPTPGDGFNVLTVSATGSKEKEMKYDIVYDAILTGKTPDGRAKPDLLAPGTVIYSTSPVHDAKIKDKDGNDMLVWTGWVDEFRSLDGIGNSKISGSSFATPHVSGIAGLLLEAAGKHGWLAADVEKARDRRTLRAVLINGAGKQVRVAEKGQTWMDRAPARGDKQPLDYDLGAGIVNALRSHGILTAGHQPRNNAGNVGWARETTQNAADSMIAYKIKDKVRKGSYVIATVVWERPTTGEKIENAAYSEVLPNLDLEVFASNADRRSSTSTVDSVEHVYHKTVSEGPFEIRVVNRSTKEVPFAVAWHTDRLPEAPKELNGRFDGDRREPGDHGWYVPQDVAAASVDRRDWMPGDDWDLAACFMPYPGAVSALAQQTPRPAGGLAVHFDAAFSSPDDPTAVLRAYLGPIDLTALAGYPDGIRPSEFTLESFRRFELAIPDGSVFTGLDEVTELRFEFVSEFGTEAFVDNVEYGDLN